MTEPADPNEDCIFDMLLLDMNDWLFARDGNAVGGFTQRAIREVEEGR